MENEQNEKDLIKNEYFRFELLQGSLGIKNPYLFKECLQHEFALLVQKEISNSKSITKETFCNYYKNLPISEQLFVSFSSASHKNVLNENQFVIGFYNLYKGTFSDTVQVIFNLLDQDKDGVISPKDVRFLLMLLSNSIQSQYIYEKDKKFESFKEVLGIQTKNAKEIVDKVSKTFKKYEDKMNFVQFKDSVQKEKSEAFLQILYYLYLLNPFDQKKIENMKSKYDNMNLKYEEKPYSESNISEYANKYSEFISKIINKNNPEYKNDLIEYFKNYIRFIFESLKLIKEQCINQWSAYIQDFFIKNLTKDLEFDNNQKKNFSNDKNIDNINFKLMNNNINDFNGMNNNNNIYNNMNIFNRNNNMNYSNPINNNFNKIGDTGGFNQYNNNKKNINMKLRCLMQKSRNYIQIKQFLEKKINIERENKEFSPKDIQDKNFEIIREIEMYSLNFLNDYDKKENENMGKFLMNIAMISRNSYINSYNFLLHLINEYISIKNELLEEALNINISSLLKNLGNIFEKNVKDIMEHIPKDHKDFFKKLYYDLFKLYSICDLSFPPIMINFNLENVDYFDHRKMIDFLSIKGNKKPNFAFLPSLYSNENYLENGKQWVFAYKIDGTMFFYEEKELEQLENLNCKIKSLIPIPNIIFN